MGGVTVMAGVAVQVWDTASGQLKLTLTGHIEQVCHAQLPSASNSSAGSYRLLGIVKQLSSELSILL